ncbi:PEP-CTERM sorting domain-containing protein [Mucisphaera sp.]|uniref:PEP-CTERM sorting domain-containing protein n=1 Tax=Mucisphaera sp. TaxID=2913024 RepID=UPI003D13F90B
MTNSNLRMLAAAGVLCFVQGMTTEVMAGEEDKGPHVLIGALGSGQLGIGFEATEPVDGGAIIPIDTFEAPIPFTGLTGFRNIPFDEVQDLAFEAPDAEEAEELAEFGLVPVADTANLALEIVSINDDFALFLQGIGLIDEAGEQFVFGAPEFDFHPLYILETTDTGLVGSTTGSFRIVDLSGGLTPSDPFSITLTVPEPASVGLLGLLGMGLLRRR